MILFINLHRPVFLMWMLHAITVANTILAEFDDFFPCCPPVQEWSSRLSSKVVIRPGMEHVPRQPNTKRFGDCKCHRLPDHEEL